MPRVIQVAHSPDSDDAFMFWALAEEKLDTGDLRYVHQLADIETLNRRALAGELEVSAVSIHAYAYLADRYALLGCGASMGDGYGPRVVARVHAPADPRAALAGQRIAVPGLLTTAYLALRLYQPAFEAVVMPFDRIEDAVLALGGNVVRRDLGAAVLQQIAGDLRSSIRYALEHRAPALAHAGRYSRGLTDAHTDQFVGMYVNQWTVDWGPRGRQAVQLLLDRGTEAGYIPHRVAVEFVG